MDEVIPYDQAMFNAGYYGGGERGGFRGYDYNSPEQQSELSKKFDSVARLIPELVAGASILFVGCAKGYEVAKFRSAGLRATGVDISRYAIENCVPEANGKVQLYDGCHLPYGDRSVDVVAAFDVLTLIPPPMLYVLAKEMCRVANRYVMFRTMIKSWRNMDKEIDGTDGVSFRFRTFDQWVELFERDTAFELVRGEIHLDREMMFCFRRL